MTTRARAARVALHYLRHRFRALHPYEVQAVLMNGCNLSCAYCRCPDLSAQTLSTDAWQEIVAGLARLGTMRIKFQGGEPTLRHDFADIARASQAAGLITAVVTNGTRIAARPNLLDHLDEVVVSLDAVTPGPHDRLRGAGTHALAVRTLRLARDRGLPRYVVMVVTRETVDEIEPMLAFCESLGAGLHAQPVLGGVLPTFAERDELALSDEQIREMHRRLARWKREGRALMFSAASYERTTRWSDYTQLSIPSAGRSRCMAGRYYVHIDPNGDVFPCGQTIGRFRAANIPRDGLQAALAHATRHSCGDCFTVYLNERKALFGLQPRAVLELLRRG